MCNDIEIIINTQNFTELYQEFLRNKLILSMESKVSSREMLAVHQEISEFESLDESIKQGTIHMQEFAVKYIKVLIDIQSSTLERMEREKSR